MTAVCPLSWFASVHSPWQTVSGLDAWQVTQIPRCPDRLDPGADPLAAQRIPVLAAAYHRGTGPVAFAWLREREAGPVRVLAAGQALAAGQGSAAGEVGQQVMLKFPVGARGVPLPAGGLAQALAGLPCWIRVAGIADGLLTGIPRGERPAPPVRPSLEDGLLAAWPGPFGWLVLAEPIGRTELNRMARDLAMAQLAAMKFEEPRQQLRTEQLRARHVELLRGHRTGLWRVNVLAGALSGEDAAEVAALFCCSADLDGLPYGLSPQAGCASLEQALAPSPGPPSYPADDLEIPEPEAPFAASSDLVAALARPPAREVPGVRFVLRPDFDLTPETAGPGRFPPPGTLALGTLLDRNRLPAGELPLPFVSLNRHVGVYGATGAGKSQTVRALLERATAYGLPWLVIEPAKSEYSRGMAARLPGRDVIRIRPGDADQPPAGINPLEPACWPDGIRFPLQTHADLVKSLFLAAFQAEEPFPQVLSAALTRVYEDFGWDLVLGEPANPGVTPSYPVLSDLQAAADQVVLDIGYGPEVERNVRGFISVRLGSLRLGTPGRFFEGGHPLSFGELLDARVVLEVEDVGDDQDKAFLMGTVLIRLTEHLRLRERHGGTAGARLRHLTVLEEAHRLLRRAEPGEQGARAKAVEMFAALFAEVRAYGEGLVVAEQIPAKLLPDVIKNTAVKIVHRLPAEDDRHSVGATMNLTDDQNRYLVTLAPGEAAVTADGADYPWLVRMPDGTDRERAGQTGTASPASIIKSRSPSCSSACQRTPCTLRQIRAAQRAAQADPRITLWAELSVLGHLTGWPMPALTLPFAETLRAEDTRLRDCALAQAVDAATVSRAIAMCSRVSPHQLAAHVTAAMRQGLADGTWLCDPEEPQYLVPPPADSRSRKVVIWGLEPAPTSAIERAVGSAAPDEDWGQRLSEALGEFRDLAWPHIYLTERRPDSSAAQDGAGQDGAGQDGAGQDGAGQDGAKPDRR